LSNLHRQTNDTQADMTAIVLTRYIHFIAVFAIVGAIFTEQVLISRSMRRKDLKLMAKIDAVYGVGAILVLIAGLALWFWVGKPAEFYTRNWIFHAKFTLFASMGVLSVYPSVFFIKKSRGSDLETQIEVPRSIIIALRLELLLLLIIPILAGYMALGIGSF
jgi:putative membrane protein